MDNKNKVDQRISKFVLPIGNTVNMDRTALFVTVTSIFITQMNDIPLNAGSYATVVYVWTQYCPLNFHAIISLKSLRQQFNFQSAPHPLQSNTHLSK